MDLCDLFCIGACVAFCPDFPDYCAAIFHKNALAKLGCETRRVWHSGVKSQHIESGAPYMDAPDCYMFGFCPKTQALFFIS
jgi:hypothetical protein